MDPQAKSNRTNTGRSNAYDGQPVQRANANQVSPKVGFGSFNVGQPSQPMTINEPTQAAHTQPTTGNHQTSLKSRRGEDYHSAMGVGLSLKNPGQLNTSSLFQLAQNQVFSPEVANILENQLNPYQAAALRSNLSTANSTLPTVRAAFNNQSPITSSTASSMVNSGRSNQSSRLSMLHSTIARSSDPFVKQACLELIQKSSSSNESFSTNPIMQEHLPKNDASENEKKKAASSDGEDSVSSSRTRVDDGKWDLRFNELAAFKAEYGHCNVPQQYTSNKALSQWVRRQRYHRRRTGRISSSRIRRLDELGFIWDAQDLLWKTRFEELRDYRKKHGHCNVPYNYDKNRKLPVWMKCQRRQYKLLQEGKPSNMTQERLTLLRGLGVNLISSRSHNITSADYT
eukprot:scaffold23675_cov108-Cylindrotheca_fusiformis.AAC.8